MSALKRVPRSPGGAAPSPAQVAAGLRAIAAIGRSVAAEWADELRAERLHKLRRHAALRLIEARR